MDAREFFKDYLPPIATLVAAFTAATVTAYFAWRQARTAALQANIALEKLKFETMSDRLDILAATREMIIEAINSNDNNLANGYKLSTLSDRINKSRFYFRDEIVLYLNNIVENCYDAAQFIPSIPASELSEMDDGNRKAYLEERKERAEAKKYIIKERNRLASVLEKDLALNFLKTAGPSGRPNYDAILRICTFVASCTIFLVFGLASCALMFTR